MATFPNGRHDDQVDAMTQALNRLRRWGGMFHIPESQIVIDPFAISEEWPRAFGMAIQPGGVEGYGAHVILAGRFISCSPPATRMSRGGTKFLGFLRPFSDSPDPFFERFFARGNIELRLGRTEGYEAKTAITVRPFGDVVCFYRRVGARTRLSDHGGSTGKGTLPVSVRVPNPLGQDRDARYGKVSS
jgi:hypothetical protein